MRAQKIAANTRDPVASLVFCALGVAGTLGWLPEDLTADELAQLVGFLMFAIATVFSIVHRRSWGPALDEGLAARDAARRAPPPAGTWVTKPVSAENLAREAIATPRPVAEDDPTPVEGIPHE